MGDGKFILSLLKANLISYINLYHNVENPWLIRENFAPFLVWNFVKSYIVHVYFHIFNYGKT